MDNDCFKLNISIPFSSNRLAEIAYDVLRVDAEPKRSGVRKELSLNGNILESSFCGESARQLRVGVNCFLENITLILETFEFAGSPTSVKYSYS